MNKSDINSISSHLSSNDNKNLEIDKEYEASASSMAEEIDEQAQVANHPYPHHYHESYQQQQQNNHIPFFKKGRINNSGNSSTDSNTATAGTTKSNQKKVVNHHQREVVNPSPLQSHVILSTEDQPEEVLTPNSGYEGDTEGPLIEDGRRT